MDFMKAFDQTVREIKREVNLRVLKVPEIEQKVLDATNDEPWGPHGSALAELAKETKKSTECRMIMNVLWTRLSETGANWRNIYKALTVIEYLVANGAEHAVDDIIDHSSEISSLLGFEYVEPNGKDMGINVRRKVETILSLLTDREKIKAVRDKAAATRDKYFGLSSSGITYKSNSASYSGFGGGYGGFGGSRYGEKSNNSYGYKDHSEEELGSKSSNKEEKSRASVNVPYSERNKPKKGNALRGRSKALTKHDSVPSVTSSAQNNEEDDFDPRGSTSESASASVNQVDLFAENQVGDLIDMPTSVSTETTAEKYDAAAGADLFANATFVSAPTHADIPATSHVQENVDLFASQTKAPDSFPKIDLFDTLNSNAAIASKAPPSDVTKVDSFDPFAAVPLKNFEESDIFDSFSSNTNLANEEYSQNSGNDSFTGSANDSVASLNQSSSISSTKPTKDTFQVKSGIWADSLSRGLIDLNITASKQTSLTDIGVIGGLGDNFDNKERGPPPTAVSMGRAMGTGTGLGKSGFPTTGAGGGGSFSSFGQKDQFGNFK